MINGDQILRERYKDIKDGDFTPNGIDLRLGQVYAINVGSKDNRYGKYIYGLYEDKKDLPYFLPLSIEKGDNDVKGWFLHPDKPYILEVQDSIKISDQSAQLYLPRSSLLRAGVTLHTAVGDRGYNGKLSFLAINHLNRPFFLEKGVRFAQLVDFELKASTQKYDGDYQNDKHKENKKGFIGNGRFA